MISANHILTVSTVTAHTDQSRVTSPEYAAELCSNWWPDSSIARSETIPGMPHPLCRICANWLPDIEDICIPLNHSTCQNTKKSGCGNDWPKERNLRSSFLPTSSSPVPKEEPHPVLALNLLAPRTDQKFQ